MRSERPAPHPLVAQRRKRIQRLRVRIAGVSVASFLAVWCALYAQLATGNDPGLNDDTANAVVQTAGTAAPTGGETAAEPVTVVTRQS